MDNSADGVSRVFKSHYCEVVDNETRIWNLIHEGRGNYTRVYLKEHWGCELDQDLWWADLKSDSDDQSFEEFDISV